MPSRVQLLAATLSLSVLATACGSTVAGARSLADRSPDNLDGPSSGAGLGSASSSSGGGASSSTGGGSTSGTSGGLSTATTGSGSTSGSGAGGPAGPGGSVPAGRLGPGVSAGSINLGLIVATGVTAGNAAIGGGAATGIDFHQAYEAIIADANSHGGVLGRKINPIYHTVDATSSTSAAQVEQQACTDFTQDHHVFGVLASGTDNLISCVTRTGAVMPSTGDASNSSSSRFTRYPAYFEPLALNLDRNGAATVNGLYPRGYFAPYFPTGTKIGVVAFDTPDFHRAVDHSMRPALAAHGLTIKDAEYVAQPSGVAGYGAFSNALASAVLKLRSDQVDHVMFLDIGANLAFFFMQAADQQHYNPRYGLNGTSGNSGLADLLGPQTANSQLKDALSIGWQPMIDAHAADDPDGLANAPRKRCLALMRKAGVSMTSRNAEGLALLLCSGIWFFQTVAGRAGTLLNQSTFIAAANHVGSSAFVPANSFVTRIDPQHHDGVAAVRNMSYYSSCSCFRYVGAAYPIP
ncbi:MAG: hypothetical protein JWM22_2740 [Frankiales bacterium]|nr:hypothetical protein [Frankiales bacterium]